MKHAIQAHHLSDSTVGHRLVVCQIDRTQLLNLCLGDVLCSQFQAQLFIDQAHINHVQRIIYRQRRDHHALARNDLYQPFVTKSMQRMVDRCSAHGQITHQNSGIQVLPWPVYEGG